MGVARLGDADPHHVGLPLLPEPWRRRGHDTNQLAQCLALPPAALHRPLGRQHGERLLRLHMGRGHESLQQWRDVDTRRHVPAQGDPALRTGARGAGRAHRCVSALQLVVVGMVDRTGGRTALAGLSLDEVPPPGRPQHPLQLRPAPCPSARSSWPWAPTTRSRC